MKRLSWLTWHHEHYFDKLVTVKVKTFWNALIHVYTKYCSARNHFIPHIETYCLINLAMIWHLNSTLRTLLFLWSSCAVSSLWLGVLHGHERNPELTDPDNILLRSTAYPEVLMSCSAQPDKGDIARLSPTSFVKQGPGSVLVFI